MRRDTWGGVASVVLGAVNVFALVSANWGHESSLPFPAVIGTFAAGAFLTMVVLSAWAKPIRPWSLPALFSAPMLLFASFFLRDWVALGIIVAIAGATFLVGVAACLVVRAIVAVRGRVP